MKKIVSNYSSFSVTFLSATIEKLVNSTIVQWQNDQHELLKKDQLQREDQLQSDPLQREDLLLSEVLQREDQLQSEQLQKDEDKILNRLSLPVSDNL
ncbi:hypothetical protein [Candidatus Nitrosotalea okcheonensis]|uniref:Carrier domain-containing protein n=1 Tax=Candidatus Nitrosotalea okcheonensis TaxID=1903276 RepID=A0A2H1FEI2_9ARCH|nr:hypothetical protein [Candidatus Nitrosotalea okcheonensis]SMH71059.1 protein of unknown function [Candidatus Nitrosotalea okcheonensis]